MKKYIVKIIFLGITILFLSNCANNSKNEKESEISTRPLIHFPNIEPKSMNLENEELIFDFIDLSSIYNEVVSKQATIIYALQKEPDSIDYAKMTFKIRMPNRENSTIEYSITKPEFKEIQKSFLNPKFKAFVADFLELNWNTRKNYDQNFMSLLDRTNMIFAHEIDKNYKEQFPNNSTWFGFDSFTVFRVYFDEIINNRKGVAYNLVKSIESSEGYLTEKDKIKLMLVIDKHQKRFKN